MMQVSVVLPTYNRAACLARSIRSVLAQTHEPLELIVVDDGSTDETPAMVASFDDARVRYDRRPAREGVSAARNRGIHLAEGAWIAFQDSDDEWLPHRLERQLAAAGPGTALVVARNRFTNDAGLTYVPVRRPTARVSDITADVAFRLPGAPTWLARREALIAAGGFDQGLDCYEDWELALRLARRGRILLLDEVLVHCSRTAGSLFSDEASRQRNLQLIMTRHRATLAAHPRAWAYYCNALGQMAMPTAPAAGRRWFVEALRAAPFGVRAWGNLAASLGGRGVYLRYLAAARALKRIGSSLRQGTR